MLEVEGLTKYFGTKRAVHEVSFRIERGEIVGLLGLNGSGKTTVLRILAGALLPSAGTVRVDGRDLLEEPREAKKVLSFLPEVPPLYGEMKVRAYLEFVARLKGVERKRLRNRLSEIEERTAIRDVREEIIGHLSLGYRQRVAIAMALVNDPQVLLLDEPTAGLDPLQIVEMREMIRSLKGDHTVLLSSHLLPEIRQVCDRILMIQEGEIVGEGSEEDLARRLAGKVRVRIQVRGSRGQVQDCLSGMAEVQGIEWLQDEDGRCLLRVDLSGDVREALSERLVRSGLGILEITREGVDLEHLFLSLLKEERST